MVKFLKILGWLFAAIMGSFVLLVGVLWATGQFKQTTIELDSIVFDELAYNDDTVVRIPNFGGIEDVSMVLDDFESRISFTPQNATNKTLRLQVNKGAGLVKVPQTVTAGEPFRIEIVKDENGASLGGEVEISAYDTRGLTATSTPLKFFIDQPIKSLNTTLQNVYQYTMNTLDFSVSSSPLSALNPTKEPNKYEDESGNVTSAKQIAIEVYDVRQNALQVITNLTHKDNIVDLVHNNIQSRWQFQLGRDGKTIFVLKAFDTYKLQHDFDALGVTKDNFDQKIEQVNIFLNRYIQSIRSFHFDYDVESMTTDQMTIGNRYKIVRMVDSEKSEGDQVVYKYDYQIVTHSGQPFSGQSFIDMVKLAGQDDDIIDVRNYETFLDAMEYLYVIAIKQVSVVNAEAADLICNERITLDVHEKRTYSTEELRQQLGVKIVPNETSANLDNRIVDVKAFGARLIDGTYYLEDYDTSSQLSQVDQVVDLLNSDKNVSNKRGHVFDVLKINNKAQDATVVVDNPKLTTTWQIAVYNKLQNVKEKAYIVFTYYYEGSLDEESEEIQELMYYALMEVQIEQQEVESLTFNYEQNERYNHVILSTDHNGTRINNVTFSHALTLPNDLASIHYSDNIPTYTTIKYFALAQTVVNDGKFVIKVNQNKLYEFDGQSYYEITARDVASGNVRIEALNASIYENERYIPVEIYAYVVKTDINGNIIEQNGSYIPVSSRSSNHMEYVVRPFLSDIYVYTNNDGQYLLRNNESEAYTGLYDVDGVIYKDENRAKEQADILGTTVDTIIKTDRNIKVLVDQDFEVIVTNKILRTNGTDYKVKAGDEDFAYNDKRALEDTDLLHNIASFMWFQADGKEYDLEGYLKGTNPSNSPQGTVPVKFEGEIPFALLSTEYNQDLGVIIVKLKATTTLSDQYLDISYRRVVEEVDGIDGEALKDSVTIDARMQIQGYYLEINPNTSILAGYGADHYQGQAKEDVVWAKQPYYIPVSGRVAGSLESWQVTNYAELSQSFKTAYVDNYQLENDSLNIDEQGTIAGNYPFSLKALQFDYQLELPDVLKDQSIAIDTYPDLVVNYTPYLANKIESNGKISYEKTLPATDYIRLTQNSTQQNVASISFLKAPTTAIDIIFQCDIYLYETSKTTDNSFQNKFYQKHFSFTSEDTVLSLVQIDPMFDLLQFNEEGLVIANGKPIKNSRQSQSILKGGTQYNLNGANGAVRVGFGTEESDPDRVKADNQVFSACTFSIDSGSEEYIYFNLDGKEVSSVRADGEEIKSLSIGAYSTNVRREASFTIELLGISVTYYITVDSNIEILFNEQADGDVSHFISYKDTKTIEVSADQTINLNDYFRVQGTKDSSSESYQPIFYTKLGQDTSNYFILKDSVLQVGRAYQDKEIVIGIHYQIRNEEGEQIYPTTSIVIVKLKGQDDFSGTIDHPFDENQHMHLTLANGTTQDLRQYVSGIKDFSNYKLVIDESKLESHVVTELFGNNVSGAINGWEIKSDAYFEIVTDIPVLIKFVEIVKNGTNFVEVDHDTGYAFYLTLQPEVAFEHVDNQQINDQSSPQNPSNFGSLSLYNKDGEKVIKLIANGTEEVLYYGYESAELLQENIAYLGDVLSINEVWNEEHTQLLSLGLSQNRSVDKDTTFVLKIYTKYGKTLEVQITVNSNYLVSIHYPFHGSKTGGSAREEIRLNSTIDLRSAYVNSLPRIHIFKEGQSEVGDYPIIKGIQAYAGSTNVTSNFTISGSKVTLVKNVPTNYITLKVELFNGLVVDYELEVIVGTPSAIHVNNNLDNYDSATNTLTIFGQQEFYYRDYFSSATAYFAVAKEDGKDMGMTINAKDYDAYNPISNDSKIAFDDVNNDKTIEIEFYSRFAVDGDREGTRSVIIRVIPNVIVRFLGNSLPANHEVDLSNYIEIKRGYTNDSVMPISFGENGNITYSNGFVINNKDNNTYSLQYNEHIFSTTTTTLTLTYKNGKTYSGELTIVPDVNFNFASQNTFYGSTSESSYTITKEHWTQDAKRYTDYFGAPVSEDESFEESIAFLEGNEGDGVSITGNEVTIGAINKPVKLKVTVTYSVAGIEGSLVNETILTILPNIKDVRDEGKTIDIYAGQSVMLTTKAENGETQIKVGDTILYTITSYDNGSSGNDILKSILLNLEEESKNNGYQNITRYLFLNENGVLCFRDTNEIMNLLIPFRLNLRQEAIDYNDAYQDSRLHLRVTLHPSVEFLELKGEYLSATTKEKAFDLINNNTSAKKNQIALSDMIGLKGVSGATNLDISYLYQNFQIMTIQNEIWQEKNDVLVQVDPSYASNKLFVVYNANNGMLTFAPCSTPLVIGVRITLSGTKSIDVFVRIDSQRIIQSTSVVAQEELDIETEERKVRLVDSTEDVASSTREFAYQITLAESQSWIKGEIFTFKIEDLLSYNNNSTYSKEAFAINATSANSWVTYDLQKQTLVLQVPDEEGTLTPDNTIVQCIIAIGMDEYKFTITFKE